MPALFIQQGKPGGGLSPARPLEEKTFDKDRLVLGHTATSAMTVAVAIAIAGIAGIAGAGFRNFVRKHVAEIGQSDSLLEIATILLAICQLIPDFVLGVLVHRVDDSLGIASTFGDEQLILLADFVLDALLATHDLCLTSLEIAAARSHLSGNGGNLGRESLIPCAPGLLGFMRQVHHQRIVSGH